MGCDAHTRPVPRLPREGLKFLELCAAASVRPEPRLRGVADCRRECATWRQSRAAYESKRQHASGRPRQAGGTDFRWIDPLRYRSGAVRSGGLPRRYLMFGAQNRQIVSRELCFLKRGDARQA